MYSSDNTSGNKICISYGLWIASQAHRSYFVHSDNVKVLGMHASLQTTYKNHFAICRLNPFNTANSQLQQNVTFDSLRYSWTKPCLSQCCRLPAAVRHPYPLCLSRPWLALQLLPNFPSFCQIYLNANVHTKQHFVWNNNASNRNEYQQHFVGVKAAGA
jgi:hypothetical protein